MALCAQQSLDQVRDECYYAVALDMKEPEACARMSVDLEGRSLKRDICFYSVAKLLSDPSVCARIVEDYYRSWMCYAGIIESELYTLHPTHC